MLKSNRQYWTDEFLKRLGRKEVCLTFDDGPGDPPPRGWTLPIAEFLHSEGVSTTFFVVGQRIRQPSGRDTLAKLRDMGHFIGNHTLSHPNLTELVKAGDDHVIQELVETDHLIRELVGDHPLLFRAPFFGWNDAVWNAIASVKELQDYHGPFGTNISCFDWNLGKEKDGSLWTVADCKTNLEDQLRRLEKGVILLHDSSAGEIYSDVNHSRDMQVHELTRWLVQWLKREEYKTIGLDELIMRRG